VRVAASGVDATWSPDGTRIAYTGDDGAVHVVSASGGDDRRLTVPATSLSLESGLPSWSPDGTRLAFVRLGGVYTIRADGGGLRRLTSRGTNPFESNAAPAWSPDGRSIAYVGDTCCVDSDSFQMRAAALVVVGADGTGARTVARDGVVDPYSWSPDGQKLLYAAYDANYDQEDVYVATLGGATARLTRGVAGESSGFPAWSPDGMHVTYVRARTRDWDTGDIYVAGADGSRPTPLTAAFPDGGDNFWPHWSTGQLPPSTAPAAPALVSVAPSRSVVAPNEITELAADGPLALAAFGAGPRLWNGATGGLRTLPSVGGPTGDGCDATLRLAVAQRFGAAWLCPFEDHDCENVELELTDLTKLSSTDAAYACGPRGASADARIGDVHGAGSLLVFDTLGPRVELWRLVSGGSRNARTCPSGPRRCVPIASGVEARDVDGTRILGWAAATLEVLTARGARVSTIPVLRSTVTSVELAGDHVLVAEPDALLVFAAETGNLERAFALTARDAAGPRLRGYADGLVAYVQGIAIHVLRLADGTDRVLSLPDAAPPADARLTSNGLFYVLNQAYRTSIGRLGFVPLDRLAAALPQPAQ
jgi:hypothetical protein